MIAWPEANAFVLQHRPYRESSWLVGVLSRTQGLVQTLWRDVTPIYLFQPYHCQWQAQGQWLNLRSVEVAGQVLRLAGRRAYMGLYINELCVSLLPPNVPDDRFFGSYFSTLRALQLGEDPEAWLRFLEQRLLETIGMGIDWYSDAHDEAVANDAWYVFDGTNRFVPVATPGTDRWSGNELLAVGRHDLGDPGTRRCARQVLREALDTQLAGRPIRSRELLRPATGEGAS